LDIATHALASFALARAFFPRRRWPVFLGMIFAGTLADIDLLSALFGPAAYFTARRTFTHSLPALLVIIALAIVFTRYLSKKQPEPLRTLFLPLSLAAALHIVLDLLQSEGVAVLWPFRSTRFAADWLPPIDPWILTLLILGCFLPEFFRLITSEIGVKSKKPPGRNGALVALCLLVIYLGGRALLHSSSIASLDPHSYAGESARKVAAYPDALSVFTWHGVVETQSLLCLVEVPKVFGKPFDPESAQCLHKPEPSPELAAAQSTGMAQAYIHAVPFPRAAVAKSSEGAEIEIRSMRDVAERETIRRIGVRITLAPKLQFSGEEFVWLKELHLR
jgi:membrane-bound metal-dependent hydrolase YbcI (DUF457 family)